jgi:hypothetical protein
VPLSSKAAKRRLGFAAILALAMHAIVASFVPNSVPRTSETVEPVTLARIQRRATPTPRPSPRATPRPKPSASLYAMSPASATKRSVMVAPATPHVGSKRPLVRSIAHASPVPHLPMSGQAAGSGTGIASGGNAGSSAGSGGANGDGGNGDGNGDGGAQPCGYVTFSDPNGSRYDRSTGGFYVDIAMTVHYSNGGTSSMVLDYPWYYASESANPWSSRNREDPNFPTTFQQPPAEKRDAEPALVRYVMAHTSRDGYTLLKDCPPSPSPS